MSTLRDFDPRTVVVNRKVNRQAETLYIGRGSPWGNPFPISPEITREDAVDLYRTYLCHQTELIYRLPELNGHGLGCFCKPKGCHGDVLVWLLRGLIRMCQAYSKMPREFDFTDRLMVAELIGHANQATGENHSVKLRLQVNQPTI